MQLNSRPRSWATWSLFLLLAAVTLALAWPRWQASLRFRPVDLVLEAYFNTREIPTQRMRTLVGFAEEAIAIHDHHRYHDGLSQLHYLRGLDVYTPALERRPAFRAAEQAAIEAVRRSPANPRAWLRIAAVRDLLRDEPHEVIAAWRMSVFTGRTYSTLLTPRAGVGLAYADSMDPESRAMLRDQLLLAWRQNPVPLLRELQRRDRGLRTVRGLLAEHAPDTLGQMESRLETLR